MLNYKFYLFIFFLFAPYLSFGVFGSDLSIFYLMGVALASFLLKIRFEDFLLLFIAVLLLFCSPPDLTLYFLKFNASAFLIIQTFRLSRKYFVDFFLTQNQTFIVSTLWLLSGFITAKFPFVANLLLSRYIVLGAESGGRGFFGLTSEPSLYGLQSVFLLAFVLINNRKSIFQYTFKDYYSLTLIITACLLSKSVFALGFLPLILLNHISLVYDFDYLIFIKIFRRKSLLFTILTLSIALFLGLYAYLNLFPDSRFSIYTVGLINSSDFIEYFLDDKSFAVRFQSFQILYSTLFNLDSNSFSTAGFSILFMAFDWYAFLFVFAFYFSSKTIRSIARLIRLKSISFLLYTILLIVGPMYISISWLFLGSLKYSEK